MKNCNLPRLANRVVVKFALVLSLQAGHADPTSIVPAVPSITFTRAQDSKLYLQERHADGSLGEAVAYTAEGVDWEPVSIGADPTVNPLIFKEEFTNWYAKDLPLMAAMHCNTVRMYYDFGNPTNGMRILDRMYQLGLKAIVPTDWLQYGSVASLSNLTNVVNAYKNHPAVLGFSVGNEWDLPNGPNGAYYYGAFANLTDAANFIQTAALAIKALDTNHVVFTFMADPHIPGVHPLSPSQFPYEPAPLYTSQMVNSICTAIDVWGFNVYRGNSFQDLFIQWSSISSKPMLIGEFGADAYNHAIYGVDPAMQSYFDARLFDEAFYNFSASRSNGCCVGVLKFEWQDEWYKNGQPLVQDSSHEGNGGQPDGWNDEEYFGLADIYRSPRQEYFDLGARFNGGSSATLLVTNPMLSVVSGWYAYFQVDEKTLFARGGGQYGGRGINVALFDQATGIRLSDIRSFDTWADLNNFNLMVDYLQGLPNGSIIMFAVCDASSLLVQTDPRVQNAIAYLQSLGSTLVGNTAYNGAWAMIAVKGQGKLAEAQDNSPTSSVTISAQPTLAINADAGAYPVPRISGVPARSNDWTLTIVEPGASGFYQILQSPDLASWTTVATIPVSSSGATSWTDTHAPTSATQRFYRIYRGY